jgi:hypothetical protein
MARLDARRAASAGFVALAAAACRAGAAASSAPEAGPATPPSPPGASDAPAPGGGSAEERSVEALAAAMAAGDETSERLTRRALARIAAVDRAGPTLRSVLAVNPDALAQARALDAERRAGRLRGPLHGVPVVVKDNIETADRMPTTAGSLALAGNVTRARRARRGTPARGGRGRPGQGQPVGVVQHALGRRRERVERGGRADAQPVPPRPDRLRVERRQRGRRRGRHRRPRR